MEEEKKELKQESAAEEEKKIHKKNIRKQLLLIPAALLLCTILFWTFRETGAVMKHESDKVGNPAEQKGVCFDNLLFLDRLMIYDGDDGKLLNDIYLCIFNTGKIYSFEYYDKDRWYEGYGQHEQGYDDSIWAKAQNIFYLGRLPEDETLLLNEYVDSFDPESGHYLHRDPYDSGSEADGRTVYQGIFIYWQKQPERYGKKDAIIEVSELNCDQNGGYGKDMYIYSYDENAAAAITLIESSSLYDQWINMCLDGSYASELETAEQVSLEEAEAGDIVLFGSYEQDNDIENGAEPIAWQVLEISDGQALLLSVDVLDAKAYDTESATISWKDCSLREWLNSEFYQTAFSEEERLQISDHCLFEGWNLVVDKVFIMGNDDIIKYLESGSLGYGSARISDEHGRLRAVPTVYAQAEGCSFVEGYTDWWMRSDAVVDHMLFCIDTKGRTYNNRMIYNYRIISSSDIQGIRPVISVSVPGY
ncbi:MAG: hypothetical protein K2J95_09880 [Lachnospiraceae bacterium]|nr:hypothetical protein [Lachnospiraceae bacterium]